MRKQLSSHKKTWIKSYNFWFILLALSSLIACSDRDLDTQNENTLNKSLSLNPANETLYVEESFGLSSPLGDKILLQSQKWAMLQVEESEEFAQPRMCAHNVSRVLNDVGLPYYGDYLVPNMVSTVELRGGLVARLDNYDKQGFINSLNNLFGGHLPIGTLVNGCLYADCSGEGGDGHIAILGETDEQGIVYLYHNNWYRPDNEGGERKDYMVSTHYYDELNLRRQWMKTPWIRIHRSKETNEIVDIEGLLPEIDDLDPYTGFFITVSIMPELLEEFGSLERNHLFCPAGLKPDPMLGACVDDQQNIYGRFSEQMTQDCVELGYGQACTQVHRIEGEHYTASVQRWSQGVYNQLRGHKACPAGLSLDHEINSCVQAPNQERGNQEEVIGLFSKSIVNKCLDWGGGEGCVSGRISARFYKELLK